MPQKLQKPTKRVREYWDWIECKDYLIRSRKLNETQCRLFMRSLTDMHNGCFQSVFQEHLDECDEELRQVLQVLIDEFGPNPEFYIWW